MENSYYTTCSEKKLLNLGYSLKQNIGMNSVYLLLNCSVTLKYYFNMYKLMTIIQYIFKGNNILHKYPKLKNKVNVDRKIHSSIYINQI